MHKFLPSVLALLAFNSLATQPIVWLTDDKDDVLHFNSVNHHAIGIDTLNLVINQLQNYQYEMQVASVARINSQLMNTPNSCVTNRLKTKQRQVDNVFSLPINVYSAPRVYFFKNNITLPENIVLEKPHSLLSIIQHNPEKRIALSKDVSYGEEIDRQIQQLNANNIELINVDNRYQMHSKLLFEKLIDLSLDYPNQFKRQLDQYKGHEEVASLALSKQYIVTHIACSKTVIGQTFIDEVNKVIRQLHASGQLLQAHLQHIDKSSSAAFQVSFEQVFANVANEH